MYTAVSSLFYLQAQSSSAKRLGWLYAFSSGVRVRNLHELAASPSATIARLRRSLLLQLSPIGRAVALHSTTADDDATAPTGSGMFCIAAVCQRELKS